MTSLSHMHNFSFTNARTIQPHSQSCPCPSKIEPPLQRSAIMAASEQGGESNDQQVGMSSPSNVSLTFGHSIANANRSSASGKNEIYTQRMDHHEKKITFFEEW